MVLPLKSISDSLQHVPVGGGCCLLCTAAVLTRAQVWRVPIPPVVLSVRFLVTVVVLRCLVEELSKGRDVRRLCGRGLPLASGEARRDLLKQPAVSIRIRKRCK